MHQRRHSHRGAAFAGGCIGVGWFGVTVQARCLVTAQCKKSTCDNLGNGCTADWDCGMQVIEGGYSGGSYPGGRAR